MIRQTIDRFHKEQDMQDPRFEIYHYSDFEPPKIVPHRHNFYEIYYLLSDRLDYMIGSQEYYMQRGDFLLLPPGRLHYPSNIYTCTGKPYSRIVLWCNPDFFKQFAAIDPSIHYMWDVVMQNGSYQIRPTPGASARLHDHLLELLHEQKHAAFASKAMTYSLLMEVFVLINRIAREQGNFERHGISANLFTNIISYVHSHLSDDLSLEALSSQFFVSKGYISKLFRNYMGISVHQYVLSLRLEEARKAIQSGIPVSTASEMYGFHDYSSFFRAFRGAFLISPNEYRKTCEMQSV